MKNAAMILTGMIYLLVFVLIIGIVFIVLQINVAQLGPLAIYAGIPAVLVKGIEKDITDKKKQKKPRKLYARVR